MDPNLAALDQVKSAAIELGMKFGPKLLVAVIIMAAGYFIARWSAGGVGRMLQKFELEPPVRQLLLTIARVVVLILFAIMALQNLGVELLPLIAGLGVAGAGIALATQGVLSNLVAGLTIILTRPFRVGEYISIVKEEGQVAEISLASTTLTHPDRSRVVIPNRRIVGEILHNYGRIRQVQVEVRVAYDADLNQALSTIRELLQANPRVLKEPAPPTHVVQLADSSVTIGVFPWVNASEYGPAGGEIKKAIVEAFRARGIVIPPPRRDVQLLGNAAPPERRAA
ncbi:MAG: mechanosensitive ion channel family protein [Burkholderiales bacterium]